ncbi:MAG: hypothetical protein WCK96_03740 [Methylococcales bacterium]
MNAAITKAVQQSTLTFLLLRFMLYPLSQKTKVWIGLQRKGDKKSPLSLTVFLCPNFINNMVLIRVKSVMTDCLRETLKSFARSFAGRPTLFSPSPVIGLTSGGYSLLQRDTAMKSQNNSVPNAQAPIVLNPQTLAKVMQWLERAENHAGNLAIQFRDHESALEFTEIELEIATAYNLLSKVIMSGVKKGGV